MALINSIVSLINIKRNYQIDFFKEHPMDVQNELLVDLLINAKNTEWGLKYDYKSIKTAEDFRSRIPVQDYESLKPYIERLRQGEQNILWNSEIKWFAKSSGTTCDKSKFIPVSKEALVDCHYRGGKDTLFVYTQNYPDAAIFKGKGLTLGGSQQINNGHNNSYYGDLSAILIHNLPFWVEFIRTPNSSIALMDKWEEKLDQMVEATINENVTSIAGVPSWTLVLIKRILEMTGKSNLIEVWPELELFMHGGVSFVPYKEQFKKLIPTTGMNYMETYNASEGFFAMQDDPNSDDLLLMLDYGIYYEFIPAEYANDVNPKTLLLDEVEIGKNYAILISTNAGLWRYKIGDTVTVTSKYPFKIKITGRTKHFINAFGEELIIDNAEKALCKACSMTNAEIREYTAGPVYMGDNAKGSHEWLFEFEKLPNNIELFIDTLDSMLKELNSDYEAKRYNDLNLEKPKVKVLKDGVFYEWLKQNNKLGGQHKIPRLANNRKFVEEILAINKDKNA